MTDDSQPTVRDVLLPIRVANLIALLEATGHSKGEALEAAQAALTEGWIK